MPTAEEIAAECERIQAGWTETERRRRIVDGRTRRHAAGEPSAVPVVQFDLASLDAALWDG